jgi:putative IMPACT (imprinted ancient) family translation regulator
MKKLLLKTTTMLLIGLGLVLTITPANAERTKIITETFSCTTAQKDIAELKRVLKDDRLNSHHKDFQAELETIEAKYNKECKIAIIITIDGEDEDIEHFRRT